ncbi:hypothetical protein HHK32_004529 [Escherichia coli]|nr:hypothetical protein [Escherichia coli]
MSYPWSVSASWKYRNGHWMALRWDGNQRQAKMLSARFRVTNGAIVIHTQRLKSDPGGNLLS